MIDSEHGTTSVWVRSLNSTWWSLKRMQDRSWQKKMILHFLDVMIHAKQWGGHALHYRSVSIPRTFNFKSLHRRTNLGTERTHMCTLYFFHSWTVSVARCWWQMEHSLFWRNCSYNNTSGDIAGKTIPNYADVSMKGVKKMLSLVPEAKNAGLVCNDTPGPVIILSLRFRDRSNVAQECTNNN